MIFYSCPFNPDIDLNPVAPSGFLNLQEAWINGAVPSDLVSSTEDYNGIDSPDGVAGKPRDFADAYRMNKEYSKALESVDSDKADKSQ